MFARFQVWLQNEECFLADKNNELRFTLCVISLNNSQVKLSFQCIPRLSWMFSLHFQTKEVKNKDLNFYQKSMKWTEKSSEV